MPLPRRAFTMIEMLITVGLILLLASLIIVALRGVRGSANRVVSANALRQMCLAYNAYSADNEQQLMPGYVSATMLKQLGINPKLPTGVPFNDPTDPDWDDPNDASSYVWRLAPYLEYDWRTFFVDYRSPALMGKVTTEFENDIYGPGSADWEAKPSQMGISLVPSFGLNTIMLGGDDVHGGNAVTTLNPWDNPGNKLAATRFSEVKNPSMLIVFAPSVHFGERDGDTANDLFDYEDNPPLPMAGLHLGYCELRPPKLYVNGDWERQWRVQSNQVVVADGDFSATDAKDRPIGGGWPIARWDQDKLPVGHLDCSVTTELITNLAEDMFKWSPWETGFNR